MAEQHNPRLKTTCVKANRTMDAVSDGAFAATHHDLPAKFQPFTPLKVALWRVHNSHHFEEPAARSSGYSGDRLPFFLG